jgi:serine/threonine protein kinase
LVEGELFLVFDWMEHDLSALISSLRDPLPLKTVKCYMKQILDGLHEIHFKKLMHRDIKAANMLLNNRGQIFIADLGLMTTTKREIFSNNVITRWYKPPEILLGSTQYSTEVDMWGIGCVLFEMITGKPLFPGNDDKHQLKLILDLCGTEVLHKSNRAEPRSLSNLPGYQDATTTFPSIVPSRFRSCFRHFPPEVLDFLDSLLTLEPTKRIKADEALDHDFFWTGVEPAKEEEVQSHPPLHEYELKQRRKSEKERAERTRTQHIEPPTKSTSVLFKSTPWVNHVRK